MRRLIMCAVAGVLSTSVFAAAPKTEEEKTLYAIGVAISQQIAGFELTPAELAFVQAGVLDGAQGKEAFDVQAYIPRIRELQQTRSMAAAETEKKEGAALLAKAAQEKGAVKTASGMVIKTTKPGTGASPTASDQVKVHYHGTLRDGKVFDSSVQRNEPATFPLNGVIPCWTEGVQMMKVGGKARLVCPSDLAYGDQGAPPNIRPGATLVFDVELLDVVKVDAPAKPAQ